MTWNKKMHVLMFSPAYDLAGGAVIAANRLFQGMQKIGVDVKMLAGKSPIKNDVITELPHNFLGEKILSRITTTLGLNYIHYYSSFRVVRHPFFRDADILNFHTIHSGYFNYLALPKLTSQKPTVYTLHDVWSFTGHCGFNFDCEKWKTGCGKCPYPDTYPPIKYDSTALEWKLKNRTYKRSHLTFVTPSRWLSEMAKQSMLERFQIHTIPNGLNTDVFSPQNPQLCRKELRIPENKKVLLFGAMGLSDPRKGGDILVEALAKMPQTVKEDVMLLTFGHADEEFKKKFDIPAIHLGYINDDVIKAKIFSAADLFLFPTRNDNLPCIIQESLSCGTPVVSFNINGIPELVREGATGYLAEPESASHLAQRIVQLLEENDVRARMKSVCREVAVSEYTIDLQVKRYKDLYTSILESRN